jgi:hypothetical protein
MERPVPGLCDRWETLRSDPVCGVRQNHSALGEHDIEIRIASGFHQQINVQIIRGRIDVGLLTSGGNMPGGIDTAHGNVRYLNPGLAREILFQRLKGTSQTTGTIDDQLLIGWLDAVFHLSTG